MRRRWILALLIPVVLAASGCGGGSADESASEPATVYKIEGTDLSRIVLTAEAADRLRIETAAVRRGAGRQVVVRYSAVRYGPTGDTSVYVSPRSLTFIRRPVVIDRIDGKRVVLSKGLTPGTKVATVGVAELYGAESGLG